MRGEIQWISLFHAGETDQKSAGFKGDCRWPQNSARTLESRSTSITFGASKARFKKLAIGQEAWSTRVACLAIAGASMVASFAGMITTFWAAHRNSDGSISEPQLFGPGSQESVEDCVEMSASVMELVVVLGVMLLGPESMR